MDNYGEVQKNKGCGIFFLLSLFLVGTILFFIFHSVEQSFNDEKLVKSSSSPTQKYQIDVFTIGISGDILIKETKTSSELKATVDTHELSSISNDEITILWISDTVAEIYTESKSNVRFHFKFDADNKEKPLTEEKRELSRVCSPEVVS